jgi:hypothetical protein
MFLGILVLALVAASGALAAATSEGERRDVVYACDCGATVSTAAGDCRCGKPLQWRHVVRVEGEEALLCTCAQGCACALDAKDPAKCNCGKAVQRVSLKGSGIYFCNCGGACSCNTVTAQPGECRCGMPLKTVQ